MLVPARGFSVQERRFPVFFLEGPCEVGLVVKAAVLHNVNHFAVRFRQLLCRQFQAVVHQIGVEAHACKFFK